MRIEIHLTATEQRELRYLPPLPKAAIEFWGKVALSRSLDPASIVCNEFKRTALPLGHGKGWCYPMSVGCKNRPKLAWLERD